MKIITRQHGFSLISAIFILIVLAVLGAYMVTVGGTNRAASTAALQGARAYQAARSGIDWSAYTIITAANKTDARNNCLTVINGSSFTLSAVGLSGFTINTNCSFTPHDQQGTDNITVYRITSTATFGGSYGSPDFIQRRISATISPP